MCFRAQFRRKNQSNFQNNFIRTFICIIKQIAFWQLFEISYFMIQIIQKQKWIFKTNLISEMLGLSLDYWLLLRQMKYYPVVFIWPFGFPAILSETNQKVFSKTKLKSRSVIERQEIIFFFINIIYRM